MRTVRTARTYLLGDELPETVALGLGASQRLAHSDQLLPQHDHLLLGRHAQLEVLLAAPLVALLQLRDLRSNVT